MRKLMLAAAAALALVLPGVAHAEWHEVSTDHFIVYSDDNPARIKSFATKLERFDQALRILWKVHPKSVGPANRVTVYVVGNLVQVKKLAGRDTVAGFYRPRAGQSMAVVPRRTGGSDETDLDSLAILLHEYTHHFMLSAWPDSAYPSWFVEGFAEFHAGSKFERDGSVNLGLVPDYRGHGLRSGNALPIEKLLTAESLKLDSEQRDALYGRGWLLTHYLTFGGKRPGQLIPYLAAISRGVPPLEAAQSVFGDLRGLESELERYFKAGSFLGKQVPAAMIRLGEVTTRKLTPGEAATMDVRIVSKNGVTDKTAPGVYADAKRAAAAYPDDPGAQIMLAEAAYDAKDYAEAIAASDRALAADPKAVGALLYKARARMEVAETAKDDSAETMAAVQKLIAAAIAADPDNPESLVLRHRSYFAFGRQPNRESAEGLIKAFDLAPQDKGLRMNAAYAYLGSGRPDLARRLLLPLAFDPHAGALAKAAVELIAQIDGGKHPSSAGVLVEEE